MWCLERRLGYQESPGLNMMRQLSIIPLYRFSSDVRGLRGHKAKRTLEGSPSLAGRYHLVAYSLLSSLSSGSTEASLYGQADQGAVYATQIAGY